jgi:sulfide:quinone oxidoreductase
VKIVIAGGGMAGLETLMALRDLAGDRVDVTLVAPQPDFVYKPLLVSEPFTSTPAERHELAPIVEEFGGRLVNDGLAAVRPKDHQVDLASGATLGYDALVVCVGARPEPAFKDALTFRVTGEPLGVDEILGEAAAVKRIAFVLPSGPAWPLPIYELALMSQRAAHQGGREDLSFSVVTPEASPLIMFGQKASAAVAQVFAARGIDVLYGVRVVETREGFELMPGGAPLEADRVVSLPLLRGPGIDGLPADEHGFLPIDDHAQVKGAEDVYAAGDGTNFPVKHGGIGTEEADAAAEDIAARAGAAIEPQPFHPVIRGQLIVGEESLNLQHDLTGGAGEGSVSSDYLWWPPHKVGGRYLSAWLAGGEPHADMKPPAEGIDVEVMMPKDWHMEPMALDPYGPGEVDQG